MKIAVYTIAKNEEKFVERWYESSKEADYHIIADTGSTDNTVEIAKKLGINVIQICVEPFRFDNARNASLALVPADIDYCIALDMDEVFVAGWREELEKVPKGITRPRYKYTWSWNANGSEGLTYSGDKIHSRKGYRWTHPVHEVMKNYGIEETQSWTELEIHHYPDNTKSRSQYLPLLEMSVLETPNDDRNAHYLGREYYFNGMHDKAKAELQRHLSLPNAVWKPERAASMRYIARCSEGAEKEGWLLKAHDEYPESRESLVELSEYYYRINSWESCLKMAKKALEIKVRPLEYLTDPKAWGYTPYDMAAISSYHLGFTEDALKFGQEALNIEPNDERLKENMLWYKKIKTSYMFVDTEMLNFYLEMQKTLKPTLSIEVGAFDAGYSKEMSKIGIESFAFEASPFVYEKFKDQMDGVSYINKAVSDKNGIVKFESNNHQDPALVGHNGIKNRKANDSYSYVDIESITLNSYFKDRVNDKISLWIDCEGANKEVLMGATDILPSVESILIETEDIEYWDDQWLHDDVVEFLKTFGFEIKYEKKAYDNQRNVIFVKNII